MESKGQKTLFSEQPQLCLGKRAERWGRAAWSLPPENPVKPDVVACVCVGGAQACLLACLLAYVSALEQGYPAQLRAATTSCAWDWGAGSCRGKKSRIIPDPKVRYFELPLLQEDL